MRLAGKQKLGYFPLRLPEAERIRRFLQFPLSGSVALDPCIGEGGVFKVITEDEKVIRRGSSYILWRQRNWFPHSCS